MHRLEYFVFLFLSFGSPTLNLHTHTLASTDTERKVHNTSKNGPVGLPANVSGQSYNLTENKSKPSPFPALLPAPLPENGNNSLPAPVPQLPGFPDGSILKDPNMTRSSDPKRINSKSSPLPHSSTSVNSSTPPEPQDGVKKHDGSKTPTNNAYPALPSEVNNTIRDGGKAPSYSGVSEKRHKEWCNTSISCMDKKNLSACLFFTQNEPNKLFLVVHNDGEDDLRFNIFIAGSSPQVKQLKKHGELKVTLPGVGSEVSRVILNAGNGECILQRKQALSNLFQGLPSYSSLVTPMYGAYFLAFAVLTVGGTCLCCKIRRQRQRHGGVRYQELEMGLPESDIPGTTTSQKLESDPADGWDRDWDDGWEDEEAANSSRPMNGHNSRATGKDGWEDDWDD